MSAVIQSLSRAEQVTLRHFKEMTNATDNDASISLLRECSWDLDSACEKFCMNISSSPEPVSEDSEDSDDENEDYQDDYFIDISDCDHISTSPAPSAGKLFPQEFENVEEALRFFVEKYEQKYCTQGSVPPFFMENLKNAMDLARRVNKPIALFLTNTKSVGMNIFCDQVMGNRSVLDTLRANYVIFPYDVTESHHLARLITDLQSANLHDIISIISDFTISLPESFPLLVSLTRHNGKFEMTNYCQSSDSSDSTLAKLYGAIEEHRIANRDQEEILRERREREEIRRLQEKEYQESLAADIAKIEKLKQEKEAKRQEEARRQQEMEDESRLKAEEFQRQKSLADTLPTEPSPQDPNILHVKFRLPEGKQLLRRFRQVETIQVLVNYLSSQGFPADKFKFFNSDFPKKNVMEKFSMENSFGDAKWPVREQIFVEEI
ncbi:hypothetical protein CRE_25841 [Caenorhabditis remanei]|uniref:UBX domain-containing protein n=1 Tax=Caenorhabditis remanei TaxID=31234 RepID=E3NA94_CAERE|nr:hypothetical protein CRE_25841 [Caenorhabditis remanei]